MFGPFCSGFMGLHGVVGLIVSLIFIAILVLAFAVLFNGRQAKPNDGAMEELRLRLVRGEITKEEFERIKALL